MKAKDIRCSFSLDKGEVFSPFSFSGAFRTDYRCLPSFAEAIGREASFGGHIAQEF